MDRDDDYADKEAQLVEEAYVYLTTKKYPIESAENRKRIIRKKSMDFHTENGELCYKQKQKGKVGFCTFLEYLPLRLANVYNIMPSYVGSCISILLQGEVLLRYLQTKEEQLKVLHACHVDPTAGHLGKTRTYKGKVYVAWNGQGCYEHGKCAHYVNLSRS